MLHCGDVKDATPLLPSILNIQFSNLFVRFVSMAQSSTVSRCRAFSGYSSRTLGKETRFVQTLA